MNREIIFTIVFMVFAYIIGKYKLLPYFAAKKILKDAKSDKNGKQDNGASTAVPVLPPQIPYGTPYSGYPLTIAQQPQEKPEHRYMYFDYRVISVGLGTPEEPADVDEIGSVVGKACEEFLASLRNYCICPVSFDIVRLDDGLFLAYVTYNA